MNVERNTVNRILIPVRETVNPSFWLLGLTNVLTGLSVFCVCQNTTNASGLIVLNLTETGDSDPDPLFGEVQLLPVGDWNLTAWEQTDDENLNPFDVSVAREAHSEQIRVTE